VSEALEYRIKRNRQATIVVAGLGLFTFAAVMAGVGLLSDDASVTILWGGFGLFGIVAAYLPLILARGMEVDGYCRVFVEAVFTSYSDPPLDEWEEHLEQQDAFSNTVRDSQ